MRGFVFNLSIAALFCTCNGGNYIEEIRVTTEPNDEILLEKWSSIEKNMENGMNTVLKQVLPMLIRSSSEVNISDQCSASILRMVLGLREFKKWSLLMVDATGKIPSGVFSGTSSELGNFDQCINIAEYDKFNHDLLFRGRYCVIDMRFPMAKRTKFLSMYKLMPPLHRYNTTNFLMEEMKKVHHFGYFLSFRSGVCVPSTCEKEDVENIAKYMANQAGLHSRVSNCEVKEDLHFDTVQIVIAVVIGILVLLCLVGTAVDAISRLMFKNETKTSATDEALLTRIITCFSVEKNLHRLLHVDPKRDKQLSCIHGIRFLSMTWIILGHTYLLVDTQLLRSLTNGRDVMQTFSFQIIANALVAVDCFFFLSGFLLSNLTISYTDDKDGKGFNVPLILLRRVWRLFPSTVMTIAVTMMIPLIGSGPVWHETTDVLPKNCRQKWWTDLVFVNNFVHPSKMCLPHTWYTAADTQLFIVGIIYLVIFFKNAKFGIAFNVFLLIGSIVSTSAVNFWRGFPPILLISNPVPQDMVEFWHYAHCKPHVHLGVFSVGLALGTVLAKYKKVGLSLPMVLLFWSMSIICNMSIMFATYEWNRGNEPGQVFATFYSGIHRVAWAIGLAWTVFACIKGYGGVVNRILSWDGFVPLGRLTFLAYLWHYLIILIYNGYWRTGVDAFHVFMIWMFLGNFVVTFCMAIISYVLYEAPCIQLERVLMSYLSKSKETAELTNGKTQDLTNSKQLPTNDVNGTYVVRL